ncbi:hypothetical protein F4692_002387 [Nocardioides cavernae]|uniref:DUF559 domain-containing protein n=1 Tax=Nocardioides cavernae TaxID=1921566 RepID=A0A7Y9H4T6_9ACTN|nr:hypothetical protein [Nocardioides cavernae]NYE37254.1 hypothetical protein [Nocardioides cavernae]
MREDPSLTAIAALLRVQSGVVARHQQLAAGLGPHDVRRLERHRDLVRVLPRVHVAHTGEPTWVQRAWAAVLYAWPAALVRESALRAADGPGQPGRDSGPITVGIDLQRRVRSLPGVVVVRTSDLEARARWNLGPPRVPYDDAALDVALHAGSEMEALAAVTRAVQTRRTTAVRITSVLAGRSRAPRRAFLERVLEDVAHGTCSVLEHAYLTRVEQPDGLPPALRQVREVTASGIVYRDADVLGLTIELDGRLFHDTAEQRDADAERDLDLAVVGRDGVRLTWGQVVGRPCSTAAKLDTILRARGAPAGRACGPGCGLRQVPSSGGPETLAP